MIKNGNILFFTVLIPGSDNQVRAGEFWNGFGNRKSRVIVEAINEYMDNHPELDTAEKENRN